MESNELFKMTATRGDDSFEIDNPEVEKTVGIAIAAGIVLVALSWGLNMLLGKDKD